MSSSGDWEGDSKHLYFNDRHKELIEEKKEHLKRNYDGIGDFFLQALIEEDVLSLEEKLEEIEEKEEEIKQEKQRLQNKIQEKKKDEKLDELEHKLRDKQEQLDKVLNGEFISREEAEEKVLKKLSNRSGAWSDMSVDEIRDTRAFEKEVEKLVCTEDDVEELKKEVDSLQRRVAELNGGREDWFLDLQSVEVSV